MTFYRDTNQKKSISFLPTGNNVETVVLLSQQQIDKYKTVDYTPDGSYMKNVNRHATYKEINEYVEDKYGFKLHSAFIAQVKRECGIERGENDVPHKTLYTADNTVHGDHSMCGTEKDVSQ